MIIYIGGSLLNEDQKKKIIESGFDLFWERPLNLNFLMNFLKDNFTEKTEVV